MSHADLPLFLATEPSTSDRFRAFHQAHPGVYILLVRFAREWKRRGKKKCGIKMLWERVRWEIGAAGLPDESEDFKLKILCPTMRAIPDF